MEKNINVTVNIELARKMLKIAGFKYDEINQASDEEIFLKALSMNDCYGVSYEIVSDLRVERNCVEINSVDNIIDSATSRCRMAENGKNVDVDIVKE